MGMTKPLPKFWEEKTLSEMTDREWELLCDGCGKCCLHKLEDEDDGEVYYTNIACRLLDLNTCRCSDYTNRLAEVPECLQLSRDDVDEYTWLPESCSYRLMSEKKSLPDWHHLISGSRRRIRDCGHSIKDFAVPEQRVPENEWEEHVIQWVL